jgi:uncharacterized membrane protein YgcG
MLANLLINPPSIHASWIFHFPFIFFPFPAFVIFSRSPHPSVLHHETQDKFLPLELIIHYRPMQQRTRRCMCFTPLWLVCTLLALTSHFQAAAAVELDKSRCPAWILQYEQWHTAKKGIPGAKYLIADAPGIVGVGDHLRGFMYALRVAAATNRVLLLRWEHPGNLTDFLVPGSGIDWQWQGTPAGGLLATDKNLKTSDADKDVLDNKDVAKAFPDREFFSHDPSNKTFLVLKTNFPVEQKCVSCPSVLGKPADSYDFVCIFRYLFTPSPQVQQATDKHLQALFPKFVPTASNSSSSSSGDVSSSSSSNSSSHNSSHNSSSSSSSGGSSSGFEYQAVHLRLGMMRGEESVINRIASSVDPLSKFLLAVSCGSGMAAEYGIDIKATPMLLLADHRGIRRFSRHGKLSNVVTPDYDAVHTKMNSVEAHLQSFVDLNLIARAKCSVLSHSGFSNVGWWLSGGNSCRLMLSECYKKCSLDSASPFCP